MQAVHDGDSYGVRFFTRPDTTIWIRLHNVDCPEVVFYVVKEQPFGKEAGKRMREFLKGDTVNVEVVYTDTFGRLTADVTKDSIDLSEYVLSHGYGWYVADAATSLERESVLKTLQIRAKNKNLGLWGLKGRKYTPAYWRKKYSRLVN